MIAFLLKASLILAILLAFYKFVLEKESFYANNRAYLIACLVLTFTLPFITLPKLISEQGMVSALIEKVAYPATSTAAVATPTEEAISQAISQKPVLETPAITGQIISPMADFGQNKTVEKIVQEDSAATSAIKNKKPQQTEKGWSFWLLMIYLFGVIVLALRLLSQVASILSIAMKSTDKIKEVYGLIINSPQVKEPCSFFNYIFINPENYDFATYEQILAHEKIHVRKFHTLDLLLSEIATVVLWFNPFIWWFRKEIEKNIEYQTDDLLINNKVTEKEIYQLSLLKIATYNMPMRVTNNYNQSLLKQRILKMNTKKSNPYSLWKYAFVVPMLFVLLLVINKPNALSAQNSDTPLANEILTAELVDVPTEVPSAFEIETNTFAETAYQIQQTENNTIDLETSENNYTGDSNDCKTLINTIYANDVAKVKALLKTVDPNCIDSNPDHEDIEVDGFTWRMYRARTPLVAAARNGSLEIGKLLVDKGAKTNAKNAQDETPLIAASESGSLEFVKYLLKNGADLDHQTEEYGTALNAAARRGHLEIAEFLLAQGADIDAMNEGQGSALNAAARHGHNHIVKLLLDKGVDINAMNDGQGSALNAAARHGYNETVELLLDMGADINAMNDGQGSALNAAARHGNKETVKLLLDKGADINAMNDGQGSALNAAARHGNKETVKLLLDKGADINAMNDGQGSALNAAARHGYHETVRLLLDKGAKVDAMTDGQGSALMAALRHQEYETAKVLLEKGADPYLSPDHQDTPMEYVRKNGDKKMKDLLKKYKREH